MELGSIVRIVNPGSPFYGHYGYIAEPPYGRETVPGKRCVMFLLPATRHVFSEHQLDEHPPAAFFEEEELVTSEDVTLQQKAMILFGDTSWHCLDPSQDQFDSSRPCMYEGCGGKRERRIMVNVWGTICEVDVCRAEHARLHQHRLDVFPRRKDE